MQRTVVSVDGSAPLEWQSQLLARTYRDTGQPGPLTRLWASDRPPTPWPWDTFVTPNYEHLSPARPYTPFNRVAGLRDWCRSGEVGDGDTVLVVDPDMVFMDRFEVTAPPGTIAGADWPFLTHDRRKPEWPGFASRNCTAPPESVPTVGPAFACTGRDLGALAELLPARLARIIEDRESPSMRWVDEMWATVFCIADLGWVVQHAEWVAEVCDVEKPWPRPLLHYAFPVNRGWTWHKHSWKPGDPIPPCTSRASAPTQAFAEVLNTRLDGAEAIPSR